MKNQPQIAIHNPQEIARSPFNRQVDMKSAKGQELIESIRTHGIIEPLIVRPGTNGKPFELIAGERRWRAAMALQLDQVPIIVRTATDAEAIELQISENDDRQDTSPIEKAEKYRQLLDQYRNEKPPIVGDAAIKRLVDRTSRSKSAIYDALNLLKLAKPVQDKINAGTLPTSHAGLIAKLPADLQPEFAHAIAPGKSLSPKEENEIDEQLGQGIDFRDEVTGLVPFRDAKEAVDSVLDQLAAAKKYEIKAAEFRKKGGIALTWKEARTQRGDLVPSGEYLSDYRGYVNEVVKGVKDLPKQIMQPHRHRAADVEMVYRRKELIAALKKAGVKPKTFGGGGGSSTNYAKLERQRQAREREKKAILARIVEPLRAAAGKRNAKVPWAIFIPAIVGDWKASGVCKRRGLKASYNNAAEVLSGYLAKLPENQMAGVVADIAIEYLAQSNGSFGSQFVALAAFYGIDAKAIVKAGQAKEKQVQTPGKPKPKPKTKSKPATKTAKAASKKR